MSDIVTLNGYKIKDEKAVRSYETVALMKADTKLKEGYHVKTKGYYEANDGGHAEYIIVDDDTLVEDGGSIHILTNGLRAKLIINDYVNVKQFGAKGDSETDDTNCINNALTKCKNVIIPNGTFMVKPHNGNIITDYPTFNGGLILNDNNHLIIEGTIQCITNDYYYYQVINVIGDNVTIEGGKIYGDKLTHTGSTSSEFGYCVNLLSCKNTIIKNCEIAYGWGDSIAISSLDSDDSTDNCNNIVIDNCVLHDSRRQGISVIACNDCTIRDCEIYNISGIAPQSGIDIESNYPDDNPVKNVLIDNCYIHDTVNYNILVSAKSENVKIYNCNLASVDDISGVNTLIDSCNINRIISGANTNVKDCTINSTIGTDGGIITFNNCKTFDRFACNSNKNDKLYFNNCELNFIDSSYGQMFIMGGNNELHMKNCTINFDKSIMSAGYPSVVNVENSTLNSLASSSVFGFFGKNVILKNNIIKGHALDRLCVLSNGTEPSYVKDNIIFTNPGQLFGGSSEQYLFVVNNISPSSLTIGEFTNLIATDNYNNSSV